MSTSVVTPEVQEFLAAVREQLADLDPDEQRDILDGLEADLTDLVAERGRGALGDPVAYARELRAAAGLQEVPGRQSRRVGMSVTAFLDACHARFDAVVARLPWDATPLLTWLRPLWWIVRGWLAVQLVDWVGDDYSSTFEIVPDLRGFGWPVLLVAVAGSVQVGRGHLWPGSRRGVLARLVLVALNVFAVAVALPTMDRMQGDDRFWDGYQVGMDQALSQSSEDGGSTPLDQQAGVYSSGKWVSNIYPYDAQGRPLVGVQLFDQTGEPIEVITQPEYVDDIDNPDEGRPRVYYPWTNGAAQLLNVFPIPSRVQDGEEPSPAAFVEAEPPAIGPFPLASVPEVSLPGIETSKQRGVVH